MSGRLPLKRLFDREEPAASAQGAAGVEAWRPVLWSQWGRDWTRSATAGSIAQRCTASARTGDIVLLHDADFYSAPDSWVRTAAALPLIFEELDSRGLKPISLRR